MAGTGAAMRYERVARLNTGTKPSPIWSLMGEGFEKMDDSLNPTNDETVYIHNVSATKTLTSYAPEWSFDGTVIKDNAVVTFLRGIGIDAKTGSEAEAELVLYDVWEVSGSTVPAKKYTVGISMDSVGAGAGGEKLTFSGTLLGKGDPVDGTYNVDTDTFTPSVS